MLQRSVRRSGWIGPAGRDTPVGISLAVGLLAVGVARVFAAAAPRSEPVLRWSLVVAAVGGYAGAVVGFRSGVFLAVSGFLIFNGFVADSSGDLSWHGSTDAERLATVFLVVLVAWAAGWIREAVRRGREQSKWTWSDL